MLLLSLPVLIGDIILVYTDHHYGRVLFGGNLGVAGWLDWSVSQPQTYRYALIGLGVVADIVPVMANVRQPLRFTVLGAIGLGGVLVRWLHPARAEQRRAQRVPLRDRGHRRGRARPHAPRRCGPRPSRTGKPKGQSPLLYGLCAGLLAPRRRRGRRAPAVREAGPPGSQVELGQLNLVLRAGGLAALGGLVFWGPKLWGRRLPDRPAGGLAVLGLLAVGLIAVPDIILGFLDQPLGEVNFQLDQENLGKFLNGASFVGYVLLFVVLIAFVAPRHPVLRHEGRAGRR